jgi:hypothetical protein
MVASLIERAPLFWILVDSSRLATPQDWPAVHFVLKKGSGAGSSALEPTAKRTIYSVMSSRAAQGRSPLPG